MTSQQVAVGAPVVAGLAIRIMIVWHCCRCSVGAVLLQECRSESVEVVYSVPTLVEDDRGGDVLCTWGTQELVAIIFLPPLSEYGILQCHHVVDAQIARSARKPHAMD